jgi:hypothetical protein
MSGGRSVNGQSQQQHPNNGIKRRRDSLSPPPSTTSSPPTSLLSSTSSSSSSPSSTGPSPNKRHQSLTPDNNSPSQRPRAGSGSNNNGRRLSISSSSRSHQQIQTAAASTGEWIEGIIVSANGNTTADDINDDNNDDNNDGGAGDAIDFDSSGRAIESSRAIPNRTLTLQTSDEPGAPVYYVRGYYPFAAPYWKLATFVESPSSNHDNTSISVPWGTAGNRSSHPFARYQLQITNSSHLRQLLSNVNASLPSTISLHLKMTDTNFFDPLQQCKVEKPVSDAMIEWYVEKDRPQSLQLVALMKLFAAKHGTAAAIIRTRLLRTPEGMVQTLSFASYIVCS